MDEEYNCSHFDIATYADFRNNWDETLNHFFKFAKDALLRNVLHKLVLGHYTYIGRWPQRKMTLVENDLNERQPSVPMVWKTLHCKHCMLCCIVCLYLLSITKCFVARKNHNCIQRANVFSWYQLRVEPALQICLVFLTVLLGD